MLYEGPFEKASRQARAGGVCPVALLEGFFTDHWTFDELCSGFDCGACVATDEDMGFAGEPGRPADPGEGWKIPF